MLPPVSTSSGEKFWEGYMDAFFLPSKPLAHQCSVPCIQLELQVYSKQRKSTNYIYIYSFFLKSILLPLSNNLMRGREGNGVVEYEVSTKVAPKMVAQSRQYTRTQRHSAPGSWWWWWGGDRKQAQNSICLCCTLKRTKTLAFKNYF